MPPRKDSTSMQGVVQAEPGPYHCHTPRMSLLTAFYSGHDMERESPPDTTEEPRAQPLAARQRVPVTPDTVNYRGFLNLWYVLLGQASVGLHRCHLSDESCAAASSSLRSETFA